MADSMDNETIPGELTAIHDRLKKGDARMASLERGLAENTASTKRIEGATGDLLDLFEAARGAFKVLTWIGRLAKPIGYIAGAVVAVLAVIAAFKAGTPPDIGPK